MKVLHVMLSQGLGGIEQVFLDYTAMLRAEGIEVIPVIHPNAALRPQVPDAEFLPNWGTWDIFAKLHMNKLLRTHRPDIVLTHGNRALAFGKQFKGKLVPVAHNYWFKNFKGLKNAIAITKDIAGKLDVTNVAVIPNVVSSPATMPTRAPYRRPPVIGTMGRFVHKKGFDNFISALAKLDTDFTALIGGNGEEEMALKSLVQKLELEKKVKFIGWVQDKKSFFDQIDIFCLPSRSEPFGIVLLEAFAHGVPVVSSMNEGASVIACNKHDAILCEEGKLADGLAAMLKDETMARTIATNAFETVSQYKPSLIGKKLKHALENAL